MTETSVGHDNFVASPAVGLVNWSWESIVDEPNAFTGEIRRDWWAKNFVWIRHVYNMRSTLTFGETGELRNFMYATHKGVEPW